MDLEKLAREAGIEGGQGRSGAEMVFSALVILVALGITGAIGILAGAMKWLG